MTNEDVTLKSQLPIDSLDVQSSWPRLRVHCHNRIHDAIIPHRIRYLSAPESFWKPGGRGFSVSWRMRARMRCRPFLSNSFESFIGRGFVKLHICHVFSSFTTPQMQGSVRKLSPQNAAKVLGILRQAELDGLVQQGPIGNDPSPRPSAAGTDESLDRGTLWHVLSAYSYSIYNIITFCCQVVIGNSVPLYSFGGNAVNEAQGKSTFVKKARGLFPVALIALFAIDA